ncbi:unnamed protein product [Moneuplotes crassus]|uniref:CUB domain-containing protein n=1 Tax=Euplotes crassus TaxID=5936 RepID=A0AAD1XGN8_EUPCR|nr:unnamed protein product [Moneuplotes crassus]
MCALLLIVCPSLQIDPERYLLSCLENSSQKWCILKGIEGIGECCSVSDNYDYCDGGDIFICSNDPKIDGTAGSNTNGGYILCPSSSSDCGTLNRTVSYTGSKSSISENFLPSDVVCVYNITSKSSFANSLKIDVISAVNADITIFTSSRDYDYDKKGSMNSGSSKSVTLARNSSVYIVVQPTSSSNRIDIDYKAQKTTTDLGSGAVIGIVIGSLFCFIIIVGILLSVRYCNAKNAHRIMDYQENENNRAVATIQNNPQPEVFYEPIQAPAPIQQPPITRPAPIQNVYLIPSNDPIIQPPIIYADPTINPNTINDPNCTMQPTLGIPPSNPAIIQTPITGIPPPAIPETRMG